MICDFHQYLGPELTEFTTFFLFDSPIQPLLFLNNAIVKLNKSFKSQQDKKINDEMQYRIEKKKNS